MCSDGADKAMYFSCENAKKYYQLDVHFEYFSVFPPKTLFLVGAKV